MLSDKFILGSQSPRRKKLLEQIGLDFEILTADIEEVIMPSLSSQKNAELLALQKAEAVAEQIAEMDKTIITADTIVVLNDEILGKPKDEEDAFNMLTFLSDNTHSVITGIAIVNHAKGIKINTHKETKVTFRKLDEEEIRAYIATGSPMDKAGAYGIQDDFGAVFVSKIDGCYYNVVGLPLELLYSELKGIQI